MSKTIFILISVLYCIIPNYHAVNSWEFGVATQKKIIFFDHNWQEINSAAHQFSEITAVAYDEISNIIYFNDLQHNTGNIFSLELSANDSNHNTTMLVQKTGDEKVDGIAYDPLERALYWTDSNNGRIYKLFMNDTSKEAQILYNLPGTKPQGITVDICRRHLYWTNAQYKKQTIERGSLDGNVRTTIISTELHKPRGIFMDQFADRIYWVDDQEGNAFAINSADLDGGDIKKHNFNDRNKIPFSLVVDKASIYWTDQQQNGIIQNSKTDDKEVKPVKNLDSVPKGIMIKNNFLDNHSNDDTCKSIVNQIRHDTTLEVLRKARNMNDLQCSGNGNYSKDSGKCECEIGFVGLKCDLSVCYNYCLNGVGTVSNGTCACECNKDYEGIRCEKSKCDNYCLGGTSFISSQGYCECKCKPSYTGERCEKYACDNFCLHDQECKLENDTPTCICSDSYSGVRCENVKSQDFLCKDYCSSSSKKCPSCNEVNVTSSQSPLKENLVSSYDKELDEPFGRCPYYYKTAVVISVSSVIALALLFLIIVVVRKMYKPVRPRIKKTYKINTPLTSRPGRSEQCEITIENCCNMNICDTPCFDPKVLEEVVKEGRKDDKKHLLKNMES